MLEVMVGQENEVVRFKRVSDDKVVNNRGEMVKGLLETHGLLVMNGMDGEESGRCTCRGKSVVDWMAMGMEMRAECKPLVVEGMWDDGRGDHCMVRMDWVRDGVETNVAASPTSSSSNSSSSSSNSRR